MALSVASCGPSWPEAAYPESEADAVSADAVRLAVTPSDPIEGEETTLVLPMAVEGTCHAFDGRVHPEPRESDVLLIVDGASPGTCAIVPAAGTGSNVPLGALAPGRYVLRIDATELPFEVRPASTPPGPPPLFWQVAHEVAVRDGVGAGCGGDEHEPVVVPPWSSRAPRLHHQVAAAHPEWSAEEVENAMCAAQSVELRRVSEHELRYRHSAGSLCHTAEAIGTVHVHDDGTFEIEPPQRIDGHDVPC